MENLIINGVSNALFKYFGNSYKIYTNDIPQNFTTPCFFISVISSNLQKACPIRYDAVIKLDIHYFTDSLESKTEFRNVSDILRYNVLENLQIRDGEIRDGEDMYYRIVDNVLHFFVSYKFDVIRVLEDEQDFMSVLKINTEIE